MTRYILRRGGRVLATALFTGALFLGFVAPTAAGEFTFWTGMFIADGDCTVAAVDQSADILLFSAPGDFTCSGIQGAIQKTVEFDCVQEPTQSHIVPPVKSAVGFVLDFLFEVTTRDLNIITGRHDHDSLHTQAWWTSSSDSTFHRRPLLGVRCPYRSGRIYLLDRDVHRRRRLHGRRGGPIRRSVAMTAFRRARHRSALAMVIDDYQGTPPLHRLSALY